jgi:16S rRNA (guanine527-N7)-methyltransferase
MSDGVRAGDWLGRVDDVFPDVSRETSARLDALARLLTRWNPSLNLVAGTTVADVRRRHIDDSLQILCYMPPRAVHWVDFGSGGGFPGLVVAAVLHDGAPGNRVTLVESDQRKCVFLREAAREMGVMIDVKAERVERLRPQQAQVVSARALAPLSTLCAYAQRHLAPDGVALFLKGARFAQEIIDAHAQGWNFDVVAHKSKTDSAAAILELRNIHHDN